MNLLRKNARCIIYYNNDKCFLVLVIYVFVMLHSFFLQKVENNKLKKKPFCQNFVILFFGFCLK